MNKCINMLNHHSGCHSRFKLGDNSIARFLQPIIDMTNFIKKKI